MIVTKFFFASIINSFKSDWLEVESFFLRINNCYVGRGLYFSPALSSDPKDPESLKRELEGNSAAFFLLSEDTGADLREAYKTARDSYIETGSPKITVYAKTTGKGQQSYTAHDPQAELIRAKLGADAELYHSTYSHIDTLKLGILMQIRQLGIEGVDIRLEDGKAWQGSDALLSLDNVESVTGYEKLQDLKLKRSEIESRFYAARTRYLENPDDEAAYEEFFEASKQRSNAMQELRDIESQLYTMLEGMYEHTAQGKLSKRQAEGYRLIERGQLNEARDVLDFYAIVSESRHREEMSDRLAGDAKVNVNELMQLRDVNAVLLDWEGVEECYSEAARLEKKYNLNRKATGDYVEFLFRQHRPNEAIELGEKLRQHYQSPDSSASDEDKAFLYNALGIAYDGSQRMDKSEEMLKAALAIRTARTEGDPDIIGKGIATVHNNLGNVYFAQNRFDDAIEAHTQALEIRKRLYGQNPEAFGEYLACSCVNLGEVYNYTQKYDESVELLLIARDIANALPVCIDVPKDELLSCCYSELGAAYAGLEQYEDAEEQFSAALGIQLEQADSNPGVFEPRVAESYFAFGKMYYEAKRYQEAEEKMKAAIGLHKRLIGRTPEAFEPELAKCLSSIGVLYAETKRIDEAKIALSSAIRLYEKYKDSNPVFAGRINDSQKLLESLRAAQLSQDGVSSPEAKASVFTPEEQEIALLLTEGLSQREIIRKLGISAVEVARRVSAVREKVSGRSGADPVIEAITQEFALTRREAEMLNSLKHGKTTETIASEMFLSSETVRVHVRNLLKKLSIESRSSVADWLESYSSARS